MRGARQAGLGALLVLAGLAGCLVQSEVVQTKSVIVDSTTLAAAWNMDLAKEFQVIQHRDEGIERVRLETIKVRIKQILKGNQWTRLNGVLIARARDELHEDRVFVFEPPITDLPVEAGEEVVFHFGQSYQPLDRFEQKTINDPLKDAIQGDLKYELFFVGDPTEVPGHLELEVEVDFQMGYDI